MVDLKSNNQDASEVETLSLMELHTLSISKTCMHDANITHLMFTEY